MTRYHLVPGCNRTGKGVGWIKLFLWLIWMSRAPCDGKVCWLCHWKAKWKLLQSTAQVSVIHIVGAYQTDGKMHLTQFPTVCSLFYFSFYPLTWERWGWKPRLIHSFSLAWLLLCLMSSVILILYSRETTILSFYIRYLFRVSFALILKNNWRAIHCRNVNQNEIFIAQTRHSNSIKTIFQKI